MNNIKLPHINCCFSKFFNSPVALKNKKNFAPQEKVEMTLLYVQSSTVHNYFQNFA